MVKKDWIEPLVIKPPLLQCGLCVKNSNKLCTTNTVGKARR